MGDPTEFEPQNAEWSESDKIYYATTTQLISQSEAATWTRLSGFAVFAGLLFNAIVAPNLGPTATVLSFEPGYVKQRAGLAILGFACSVGYCFFMVRSRKFVAEYVSNARRIESKYPGFGPLSSVRDPKGVGSQAAAPMLPFTSALIFLVLTSLHGAAAPDILTGVVVIGGTLVLAVLLFLWARPFLPFPKGNRTRDL